MNDQQFIESLFEAAKNELPQTSFEEVAASFEASASIAATVSFKTWLLSNLSFNLIIMTTTLSIFITAIWFFLIPNTSNHQNIAEATITNVEVEKSLIIMPEVETDDSKIIPSVIKPAHNIKKTTRIIKSVQATNSNSNLDDSPSFSNLQTAPQLPTAASSIEKSATSNTIKITSPLPLKEQASLLSIETPIQENIKLPTSLSTTQEKILTLKNTDDNKETAMFENTLTAYGFKISSADYYGGSNHIERFVLLIKHPQGMEWQLKAKGFKQVEFKIHFDDKGEVNGLSYRFNNTKKFSKRMSLTAKGKSHYHFSKDKKERFSSSVEEN